MMQWKNENRCAAWGSAYSPGQPRRATMVNSVEYTRFPFFAFYVPCLPLHRHLAKPHQCPCSPPPGWTGPRQTWIYQSLSASRGERWVATKAAMEGSRAGQGRREGQWGWIIATSPPSPTSYSFSSHPRLPLLPQGSASLKSAVRSQEGLSTNFNQEVHRPLNMAEGRRWGEGGKSAAKERRPK